MNNNTELTVEQETMVFELVQRKAKLLASSSLVPREFQGNMANCAWEGFQRHGTRGQYNGAERDQSNFCDDSR